MTREEHISNLETIGCDGWTVTTEAYKSLQFAIKALKQEPCEDCISRQAVLDMVEDMTDQFGNKHRVITEGMISLLPPVTPKPKEIYNKGWEDGAEATAYHVELCEEENPTIPLSVIEDIKAEIKNLHNSHMINFVSADGAVDTCLEIIDKHIAERGTE